MEEGNKGFGNYFSVLWSAIKGRRPDSDAFKDVCRERDTLSQELEALKRLYCNCVEKWDGDVKRIASLQQLIENQRQRLAERAELFENLKHQYQDRIVSYNKEINRLHEEMEKVRGAKKSRGGNRKNKAE